MRKRLVFNNLEPYLVNVIKKTAQEIEGIPVEITDEYVELDIDEVINSDNDQVNIDTIATVFNTCPSCRGKFSDFARKRIAQFQYWALDEEFNVVLEEDTISDYAIYCDRCVQEIETKFRLEELAKIYKKTALV